jgi:hypothetical protein
MTSHASRAHGLVTTGRRARATRFVLLLAVLSVGTVPASATAGQDATSEPEFRLDLSRGLSGSFDGFGGQLNQHLYAKISGHRRISPTSRRRSWRSSRSSSASSSTTPPGRTLIG